MSKRFRNRYIINAMIFLVYVGIIAATFSLTQAYLKNNIDKIPKALLIDNGVSTQDVFSSNYQYVKMRVIQPNKFINIQIVAAILALFNAVYTFFSHAWLKKRVESSNSDIWHRILNRKVENIHFMALSFLLVVAYIQYAMLMCLPFEKTTIIAALCNIAIASAGIINAIHIDNISYSEGSEVIKNNYFKRYKDRPKNTSLFFSGNAYSYGNINFKNPSAILFIIDIIAGTILALSVCF